MGAVEKTRTLTFVIPALPVPRRKTDPVTGKKVVDISKPPKLKLEGYYTQGGKPNWTRLKTYHEWKDHVRLHAPVALRELTCNDPDHRMRLDIVCYFQNRVHNDCENVRKGIVDALCTGGDKWVAGEVPFPDYDAENPRVEVTVTLWEAAP